MTKGRQLAYLMRRDRLAAWKASGIVTVSWRIALECDLASPRIGAQLQRKVSTMLHVVRQDYWLNFKEIINECVQISNLDRSYLTRGILSAYWRGRFEEFYHEPPSPYWLLKRRDMLKCWRRYKHPGIHFTDNSDEQGKVLAQMLGDEREWIVLDQDTSRWSTSELHTAYTALANVNADDINADCMILFRLQCVGAYELLAVCKEDEFESPPFWRHWGKRHRADVRDLALFTNWFHLQTVDDTSSRTKDDLFEKAKTSFPWLKRAVFDRTWDDFAPDSWKRGGRRHRSKNIEHH